MGVRDSFDPHVQNREQRERENSELWEARDSERDGYTSRRRKNKHNPKICASGFVLDHPIRMLPQCLCMCMYVCRCIELRERERERKELRDRPEIGTHTVKTAFIG
jgi:hypothetical protein